MNSLMKRLADPHLVVAVQRACGVRSTPASVPGRDPEFSREQIAESRYLASGSDSGSANGNGTPPLTADGQLELKHRSNQLNGGDHCDQNTNRTPPSTNGCVSAKKNVALGLDHDGVTPDSQFTVNNWFLHAIFTLGAELGNESFYIIFYPYLFWNIDGWIARRVCWFWSIFMYAGQATKDVIKWPRPPSPPVFRLEKKYAFEYGMPSTHAMVGVGLPFLTYYLAYGRYEFNWAVGLFSTCVWCLVVCLSRLYLGMHSVLDVLAGIAFASFLLPIWILIMDHVDHFFLTHPLAPLVAIVAPVGLCLMYPPLDRWSTARGDTTLVVAVGAGVALSLWINFQFGLMGMQTVAPPYRIPALTLLVLRSHLVRLAVGGVLALATRAVFKAATYRLSCRCLGLDPRDPLSRRRLGVELPVKFVTYMAVSLVVVVITPILFKRLDIGRPSFDTEL